MPQLRGAGGWQTLDEVTTNGITGGSILSQRLVVVAGTALSGGLRTDPYVRKFLMRLLP